MAWTFAGKVKEASDMNTLAGIVYAHTMDQRRSAIAFIRARELLTNDVRVVQGFYDKCDDPVLTLRVVELYVEKYGVRTMDILLTLLGILRRIIYSHQYVEDVNRIVENIFAKTPQAFHLPTGIDNMHLHNVIVVFSAVMEILDRIDNEYDVSLNNTQREIAIFIHALSDLVVARVESGTDPHMFITISAMDECLFVDMMLAIICDAGSATDVARDCFKHCASMDIHDADLCVIVKVIRDAFMERMVREDVLLSLDEICVVAAMTFDIRGDGALTAEDEKSLIARGLPLCTSDDDVLTLCRSFATKSGKNRCVSAYLARCETLDRWMLAELAASVPSMHAFGGPTVHKDLIAAKERFALALDLQKVFEQSERKMRVEHFLACARRCF